MSERLRLQSGALVDARVHLATAADTMHGRRPYRTPTGFASVTHIEGDVERVLRGLAVARAALGDAAASAGSVVAELLEESDVVDSAAAAVVGGSP